MQTNKIQCSKCGTVNTHHVKYHGRVIKIEEVDSTHGLHTTVTKTRPNIDEFLLVTCSCCGYSYIDAVETKLFNDKWEF